jgi:hypothetical protein
VRVMVCLQLRKLDSTLQAGCFQNYLHINDNFNILAPSVGCYVPKSLNKPLVYKSGLVG